MRIAQRGEAARQQIAGLDQLVHHRLVGRTILAALLALETDDFEAFESGAFGCVAAELVDGVGDRSINAARFQRFRVVRPHHVIVIAMARRRVDEARAGVVGDMIAREQRHIVLVSAEPSVAQRVHTGEPGGINIRHARPRCSLRRLHHIF
jgi:hypothetical protein